MSRTRVILVVFGLLDALLLGSLVRWISIPSLPTLDAPLWWFSILEFLRPFLALSLAVSALGLALERRWALILSYVQFPFRIAYVHLSFGFLWLITVPLIGQGARQPTMLAALCLEGVRLVATILLHVFLVRSSRRAALAQ